MLYSRLAFFALVVGTAVGAYQFRGTLSKALSWSEIRIGEKSGFAGGSGSPPSTTVYYQSTEIFSTTTMPHYGSTSPTQCAEGESWSSGAGACVSTTSTADEDCDDETAAESNSTTTDE